MKQWAIGLCLSALLLATAMMQQVRATDSAVSDSQTSLLKRVKSLALEKGVWETKQWKALLHFPEEKGVRPSLSVIRGGKFFLSPEGAHSPRAEGEATLEVLLGINHLSRDVAGQCLYPARYRFLRGILQSELSLPHPLTCPALDRWIDTFRPAGVTLVFAEAYLNNPASMFGHTFLRIDNGENSVAIPLLAASIGYAAITDDHQGLLYATKGIFGGYSGRYNSKPYHEQLRVYGGIENRDIWEYTLDLSQEETRYLLYHLWELRRADFTYYFFDENCSYQLLALLKTVRPDLPLPPGSDLWTMPLDTVRLIREKLGRDVTPRYRPSRRTQLDSLVRRWDSFHVRLAKDLADGSAGITEADYLTLSDCNKAAVLDLAISYLLYREDVKAVHLSEQGGVNPRLRQLMVNRSGINCPQVQADTVFSAVSPDRGHPSSRLTIGTGVDSEDRMFMKFGMRPLLHDLSDPPDGYTTGAQFQFMDTSLRWYPSLQRLSLESVTLLDIVSLPPGNGLFMPFSWKVYGGVERMRFGEGQRELVLQTTLGGGMSFELRDDMTFSGLLEATVFGSDKFNNYAILSPGVNFGLRWFQAPGWSAEAVIEVQWPVTDNGVWIHECILTQSWYPDEDHALQLVFSSSKEFSEPATSFSLQWNYYF